jgi:hypothetical protein
LDSNGRAWASEHAYLKNLGLGWVVAGDLDHLPAFLVGKEITQHEQVETPPRQQTRRMGYPPRGFHLEMGSQDHLPGPQEHLILANNQDMLV